MTVYMVFVRILGRGVDGRGVADRYLDTQWASHGHAVSRQIELGDILKAFGVNADATIVPGKVADAEVKSDNVEPSPGTVKDNEETQPDAELDREAQTWLAGTRPASNLEPSDESSLKKGD